MMEDTKEILTNTSVALFTVISFWIISEVLNRCKGFCLAYIMPKFETNIKLAAFKYVNQHSYSYFIGSYVGSIANRINDLPRSANMIMDILITVFAPLIFSMLISSSLFFEMKPTLSFMLFGWLSSPYCTHPILFVQSC